MQNFLVVKALGKLYDLNLTTKRKFIVCLQLPYSEALLWKREAQQLVNDAKAKLAKAPVDPLFKTDPKLSRMLSVMKSITIRHGKLIERALIFAIRKLPNWQVSDGPIYSNFGTFQVDCIAYNSVDQLLYVFECKRGHSMVTNPRLVDWKLSQISMYLDLFRFPFHRAPFMFPFPFLIGPLIWRSLSINAFILSFYGKRWKSKFSIYDKNDIDELFAPCVAVFLKEYADHTESKMEEFFEQHKGESKFSPSDRKKNIFDDLDPDVDSRRKFIVFEVDKNGNPDITLQER